MAACNFEAGDLVAEEPPLRLSRTHLSYCRYHGYYGYVKGGHRILHEDYIMGLAIALTWDPGPLGLPEILTVAHVELSLQGSLRDGKR